MMPRQCPTTRNTRTPYGVAAGTAAALLTVLMAGGAARADELPSRKPGLWEVTIQSKGQPEVKSRQCIDAKTDAQMQSAGQGVMKSNCSKNAMRREGSTWVNESVCRLGNSTLTSRSVISGDFEREIRMVIDAQYAPPLMGKSTDQTTVTQRHAGACPAGWKPGEMEVPGMGQRIDVTGLAGGKGKR
jgi:hypothetical protein